MSPSLSNLAVIAVVLVAAAAAPSPRHRNPGAAHPDLLQAELKAWAEAGQPEMLQFPDDEGKPVWASITDQSSVNEVNKLGGMYGINDTADDVKFHVFTKSMSDVQGKLATELDKSIFEEAGWDSSLPTKVVIHGFTNTIASPIIQNIKNAYLASEAVNVVGVDWGVLCPAPLYINARLNVPASGRIVGELLQFLVEQGLTTPDKLHVIGHSLGAHVSGLAAQAMYEATGTRPHRITGLDPAWPLFILAPESDRLSEDDADLVDVIHTCAGRLGFLTSIGTSDFYPNGGSMQPGCGLDIAGTCAHSRSHAYFVESIKERKGYQAVYCEKDVDARRGSCTQKPDGCMGDKVQFKQSGSYYLTTNNEEPIEEC